VSTQVAVYYAVTALVKQDTSCTGGLSNNKDWFWSPYVR